MKTLKTLIILMAYVALTQNTYAATLKFPADCKNKILEAAAQKNGCYLVNGADHKKVYKDPKIFVTIIPNSIKSNDSCRSTIKAINASC